MKVLKYWRFQMNGMKVKVSDGLDNVPNENVVTTGDQQTNQQTH